MAKKLKQLLENIIEFDHNLAELEVSGLSCDSRSVKPGDLFFAIPGAKSDGFTFVQQAVLAGAIAVIAEKKSDQFSVPVLETKTIRNSFSRVVDRFYDNPSANKQCIAVTGTNGKTSTTWILSRLLGLLAQDCVLVGTLGIGNVQGQIDLRSFQKTNNTTPAPDTLLKFLAATPAKFAAIEATSQGLVQYRTCSINWDAAIFTNLTHDHLDLHAGFEDYANAKAKLFFEELAESKKENKVAVINIDDAYGIKLYQQLKQNLPQIKTIGISVANASADCLCSIDKISAQGLSFTLKIADTVFYFKSALVGMFNLWNLTSAITTLHALGFAIEDLQKVLPKVESVPGRLEHFSANGINVYVDYAHTPDALDAVQKSLLELKPKRLITVFGCGGDRDRSKRPLMAKSVAKYSDFAIVTSDNPRTEDPEAIVKEIESGLVNVKDKFSWKRIIDRAQAIKAAIEYSSSGDIILVAGKGHEDYQEVSGVKHAFDDRVEVQKALN